MSAFSDKEVFITGSTSGIGKEAALLFAKQGSDVHIHGRNSTRATELQNTLSNMGSETKTYICDFSNLSDVKQLGEKVSENHSLDILVNNAGGYFRDKARSNRINYSFLVNHLAPFTLTYKLIDSLIDSEGQIITTASEAHRGCKRFNLRDWINNRNNGWKAYCRSKLCNIQFSYYLSDFLQSYNVSNVQVNCFHPGGIPSSGFLRHFPSVISKLALVFGKLPIFDKPIDGAEYMLSVAKSNTTKQYYNKASIDEPTDIALNEKYQGQLWNKSSDITECDWHSKLGSW